MPKVPARPQRNAIPRGTSVHIPKGETHSLMKVFEKIPADTLATQEFIDDLTAPMPRDPKDPALPAIIEIEQALVAFRYPSEDEANSLLDFVDDCMLCTAAFGNSLPEINRIRNTKLDSLRHEIATAGKRFVVRNRPERWGGGPEWGSDVAWPAVRRARPFTSPFSMNGGSLIFAALDLLQGLRCPIPTTRTWADDLERAVDWAQTAIAEQHVLCLVVTGLTSMHLAHDFPAVMRALDALRRHRMVVVLDVLTAGPFGQSGTGPLTGLRKVFNPCMGDERTTALDQYWQLLGGGEALPAAMQGLSAEVYGQRRWMREVVTEAARPECRSRQCRLSARKWFDWLGAAYHAPLRQWDRLIRHGTHPDPRWCDWVPDPDAYTQHMPNASERGHRGSGAAQ
ncbi:hypothetical protein [Cupriavidus sp. CuC1]|uniref:hypothetical protein n=1 Tax=Cupriavidus sp. CuC1 TaxID=3373131 RepID=UPI0037D4E0D6